MMDVVIDVACMDRYFRHSNSKIVDNASCKYTEPQGEQSLEAISGPKK